MAVHIETGTMHDPKHYQSKQLKHLGLVAGMYDELGIGTLIDQLIPQDLNKRNVSIGQAVKAMVLNNLGFTNKALYLASWFFRDQPVDRLIGEGVEAEHLNDDVLGRALDALYKYGPEKLYPQLAGISVKRLALACRFVHMDSTGFHVDGQYNSNEEPEEGVVHITKGYSRDHRPDLNQVVLQLICEHQAAIPLLMQTLDGNNSDKKSFGNMVTDFTEQMHVDFAIEYLIADSALYTAENLKAMSTLDSLLWISRVPENLSLACDVIDVVAPGLMSDLNQPTFRRVDVEYGVIEQRWVVVFSPQAHQRALKTVNKQCNKLSSAELKAFNKLCAQEFACEADAHKALVAFEKNLKMTVVSNIKINADPRFNNKGRPAKDRRPDYYVYCIEGTLACLLEERTRRLERKSCFILASNQLNCEALSDEDLIKAYKDQQKVERGFRFLKDPMFMASTLFLESPKRIMALMMVMTLSLLVYAALEHRIREVLKTHDEVFPDQKGQLIQNPTARWVFQYFKGICVLVIEHTRALVLNLNEHQIKLLRLLGKPYEALYAGSG